MDIPNLHSELGREGGDEIMKDKNGTLWLRREKGEESETCKNLQKGTVSKCLSPGT